MTVMDLVRLLIGTAVIVPLATLYTSMLYVNRFVKGALLGPMASWKSVDVVRDQLGIKREAFPFAILFAYVLLVLITALIQNGAKALLKGFDNETPRAGRGEATGFLARVYGLHTNTFENLQVIAVALFTANLLKVPLEVQTSYAILFLIFRVLYTLAYLGNAPALRSFFFFASLVACYLLILNALYGPEFDKQHTKFTKLVIETVKGIAAPGVKSTSRSGDDL